MKKILIFLGAVCLVAFAGCKRIGILDVVQHAADVSVDTAGYATRVVTLPGGLAAFEAACPAHITYHQTDSRAQARIVVKAPAEMLEHTDISLQENVRLVLDLANGYRVPDNQTAVVDIYAPHISAFSLRGGGKCLRLGRVTADSLLRVSIDGVGVVVSEELKSPRIEADLRGVGSMALQGIEARDMKASLKGTGSISLGGRLSGRLDTRTDGAGVIDTDQLEMP